MSTAVMHQAAMYDFGELLLKNQAVAARNAINQINNNGPATHQLLQQALTASTITNNNTNNNFSNNSTLQQHQMNNNPKVLRWEQTKLSMAASQQANQLHQVLLRTNSSPVMNMSMTSLMNSLMENYEHRKLERSRSEPAPHLKVSAQAQAALAAQINTSRYKTELCRPFEEAGTCKYGDKCQFAHGILELRNLQRHPKYKTELCRTFHSVGFCPYGPRCHFIHNAEEAKEHNRTVKAYLDAQAKARLAQEAAQHRPTPLSLSPTFSMSTSSDRTTPPDSNSPSPTSPLASFFGVDQEQNHHQLEIHSPTHGNHGINFPSSPTYSTAGPAFTYNPEFAHSTASNASNASNSPPTSPPIVESTVVVNANGEESRLPVFNRLSSVFGVENLKKI